MGPRSTISPRRSDRVANSSSIATLLCGIALSVVGCLPPISSSTTLQSNPGPASSSTAPTPASTGVPVHETECAEPSGEPDPAAIEAARREGLFAEGEVPNGSLALCIDGRRSVAVAWCRWDAETVGHVVGIGARIEHRSGRLNLYLTGEDVPHVTFGHFEQFFLYAASDRVVVSASLSRQHGMFTFERASWSDEQTKPEAPPIGSPSEAVAVSGAAS